MKHLRLFFLLLFVLSYPSQSIVGEAVYRAKGKLPAYCSAEHSPFYYNKNLSFHPPVERGKAKEKHRKKKKQTLKSARPFKQQQIQRKRSVWAIVGSIVGFTFLWAGIFFLPLVVLTLLLGIFSLQAMALPLILIVVGIFLIASAMNSAHQVESKILAPASKRKRTFSIASLIIGAASLLSSLAFIVSQTILVALQVLPFVVNIVAFVLPILGILLGLFMILSSIPNIDQSYGTYSNDPIVLKKRLKRQMIYSFIGFTLFAIAAVVIFFFGAWILALGVVATAIGMLINALMKVGHLKKLVL